MTSLAINYNHIAAYICVCLHFLFIHCLLLSASIYHRRCPYNGRINGGLYASLHIGRDDGPSSRAADPEEQRNGRFPLPRSYSCFIILLIQCNRDTTSFCCIYFGGRAVWDAEKTSPSRLRVSKATILRAH